MIYELRVDKRVCNCFDSGFWIPDSGFNLKKAVNYV
jgi:hypothetical protein